MGCRVTVDEVGNIAFQCPDVTHYHVQDEAVLVEVVDAVGVGVAAAQDAYQCLRRPLVDHLDTATPHDEHAVGHIALAQDPISGPHLQLLHLAGQTLEQLIRQAGQQRDVAQEGRGAHHLAATRAAPSKQRT